MIYKESQVRLIEDLPMRENRAAYLAENAGGMWNTKISRRDWHTCPERNPWSLAKFLLKKYTGKSYDKMFSEWSSRVRHNDLLREYKWILVKGNIQKYHNSYYVNDMGIVKKEKKKKSKYKRTGFPKTFYSDDYKCAHRVKPEFKHLIGKISTIRKFYSPQTGKMWEEPVYLEPEYGSNWWIIPEPFKQYVEKVTVEGFSQTFERSCPEYQKLWYERDYERRRSKKEKKKAQKEKVYVFKHKKPEEVVKPLYDKSILEAMKGLNEVMTNQQS